MPHGKLLSDYEKGQINAFITCWKNELQIAKLLDISPTVIRNYSNQDLVNAAHATMNPHIRSRSLAVMYL